MEVVKRRSSNAPIIKTNQFQLAADLYEVSDEDDEEEEEEEEEEEDMPTAPVSAQKENLPSDGATVRKRAIRQTTGNTIVAPTTIRKTKLTLKTQDVSHLANNENSMLIFYKKEKLIHSLIL